MTVVALLRAPRASTNKGRDPLSRWYIRGVLHSHPFSTYAGALVTLLLLIMTPVAVISALLLLLSGETPEQFAWVPAWLLAFPHRPAGLWHHLSHLGHGRQLPDLRPKTLRAPRPFEKLAFALYPRPRSHPAAVHSHPAFPLVPLHPLRHSGPLEKVVAAFSQ